MQELIDGLVNRSQKAWLGKIAKNGFSGAHFVALFNYDLGFIRQVEVYP